MLPETRLIITQSSISTSIFCRQWQKRFITILCLATILLSFVGNASAQDAGNADFKQRTGRSSVTAIDEEAIAPNLTQESPGILETVYKTVFGEPERPNSFVNIPVNSIAFDLATATASDNDYTRINNAVQNANLGDTITLNGTFDWTEPNAAASWALGSDGIASTADDYSISVPAGKSGITLTASSLGSATIQGPGDLAAANLEAVLLFDGGPSAADDNQNWTISNIRFLDFDLSIAMFNSGAGVDAFNGAIITNNYFRIARDLNATVAPADANQNIGLHYSFGANQTISNNTFEIQGDGVSAAPNFASDVAMQSNTSGGNVYDGLQITGNTVRVLNAQNPANPQVVIGIWENAHGHSSNITVNGNKFENSVAGNPATNLQRGFRVTSHSSATTTVEYLNNSVEGASIGFQWLSTSGATQPVKITSNRIVNNATGFLLNSGTSADLKYNRIAGNTVAGIDNNTTPGVSVTANDNWWGCNAGPGNSTGCTGTTNGFTGAVTASTWLILKTAAAPAATKFGGTPSLITSDLNTNSANTPVTGFVPDTTPITFGATPPPLGSVSPTSATTANGAATSTFTAANSAGIATVSSTVDGQTVNATVNVDPVVTSITRKTPLTQYTTASSVVFEVVFNAPVKNVDDTDFVVTVLNGGITGASISAVSTVSPFTTYQITVTNYTGEGEIRLDLIDNDSIQTRVTNQPLGGVGAGNGNFNTGETYIIDINPPTVTIKQAPSQPDSTNVAPIIFDVVFSEDVGTSFTTGDVTLSGTAGATTATVSGSGANYTVTVTGMTNSGTVIVNIPASVATDLSGKPNNASTTGVTINDDNIVNYFVGGIALVVDDDGMASATNCGDPAPAYTTIQSAVVAAGTGYTIKVCSGTYPLATTVNVGLTNLTIIGAEATKPLIQVGDAILNNNPDGFNITATGVTLEDLEIEKIGTGDQHHMVRVQANNFTGRDNYIHGPSWQTPNHVSRAYVFNAGVTGFLIEGNTIEDLRQPAYTTGGSGTASNNTWTGTKGWVNDGGLVTFTNNTMTTCAACDTDIALLNNPNPAYQTFYANRLALSNANNNAHIDVQFTAANDSGRVVSYVNAGTGLSTNDGRMGTPYQSIQQAIFNPASGIVDGTLPGGTVNVAGGNYVENVSVSRQLTILGPNAAIDPNTGTRVLPEAVIRPAVGDLDPFDCDDDENSSIVTFGAEGIVFKGFTLDGDNPLIDSDYEVNGADVDAYNGINGLSTTNPNADISFNIVKNTGEFGIVLSGNDNAGVRVNSKISNNKVDNVVGICFGEAIRIGENAFANVEDNVITNSFNGVTVENFNSNAGVHPGSVVDDNAMTVYGYAVYFNLHYAYSNPSFTVSDNTINSYVENGPAPFAGNLNRAKNDSEAKSESPQRTKLRRSEEVISKLGTSSFWDRFIGIRVESINGSVPVTFSGNTIAPNRAGLDTGDYEVIDGIRITNPSSTSPNIDITGNSISSTMRGIAHTAQFAVPEVTCNNFVNNDVGIYIGNGTDFNGNPESAVSGILANNNNILGNSLFGVQAQSGTAAVNNAQMNYWGAADGPGPVGPGSGDKVSTNVDFSNFLTAPTNCTPVAPPPTVTINQASGQNDPTNTSPINFTVVFSEPVTGFTDSDVILGGTGNPTTAVVTQIAPNDGTTYNVAVSGMTNGTVTASVAAGAATGANGANVASTSTDNTVTFDSIAPTVTASPSSGLTNNPAITFTVDFSNDINTTTFTQSDLTGSVTNGSITSFTNNNDSTYTIVVTAAADGAVTLTVPAGVATDTAGNGNTASNTASVTYDGTAPTVAVEGVSDPDASSPVAFTVTFSEPITGFTASDVLVSGTAFFNPLIAGVTVTEIAPNDGTTYSVSVSGMNQSGTVKVTIPANSAIDAATNGNALSTPGTPNGDEVQFNTPLTSVTVNPTNTDTAGITDWSGFNDNTNSLTPPSYVVGPGAVSEPNRPGVGSARLNTTATGKYLFFTTFFNSASALPFSQITNLRYSSYAVDASNPANLPSLQFGIDYDSTDMNTGFQGRLVFEPANNVTPPNQPTAQNQWQTWDATNGRFWFTQGPGTVACGIAAPCSLSTILTTYPRINIPNTLFGFIGFRSTGGGVNAVENYVDNFTIGINSADTTFDFEPTPPTVSVSDAAAVTEGDSGTTTATFTVSLTGGPSQLDTTVQVSTGDGGATAANSDYVPLVNQVVTIPAGQLSTTFTVNVNGDNFVETDETFVVNLSNAVNAAIADGQGSGTITNDDNAGTLQFSSATYIFTEGAAPSASITITRTGGNDQAVSVDCSTVAGGTATAGSDYTATTQTINFADQDSAPKTCLIPVTNDNIAEPSETVNLSLSSATGGATIGLPSASVLTINDNGNFILISGNIQQYNAPAPNTNLAGVTVTLSGSASATTTTDSNGNYIFNGGIPAGSNNYLVTPSLAGKVFDPINRSYVNLTSNVTNANFVAYNTGGVPRNVRIVNTSQATYTSNVTVPIEIDSLGTENALSFSLNYNSSLLDYSSIACGADAPGCAVSVNDLTGNLGVEFNRDSMGGPTVFTAGNGRQVVLVTFTTTPGAAFSTPITFGDSPAIRDVNDVAGNSVPTNYVNGQVVFAQGIEGDVAPPPTGNGSLGGPDVSRLRQYVSGAASPDPNYNEFQRADVAPAGSKGNGLLSSADITVLRNYISNSVITPAGGPTEAVSPLVLFDPLAEGDYKSSKGSVVAPGNVRVVSPDSSPGQSVSVPIQLESEGLENGVTVSLQFDQTKLTYTGSSLGPDVTGLPNTTFDRNLTQLGSGRIGLVLTLDVGATFTPGNKNIFVVTFTVAPTAPPGLATVNFTQNQPLLTETNDVNGNTLSAYPADFISGGVNVLSATSANAVVGGRLIDSGGNGIARITVTMTDGGGAVRRAVTNSFGNYNFEGVAVGGTYIIGTTNSKNYRFTPEARVITVSESVTDVDFVAEEQ